MADRLNDTERQGLSMTNRQEDICNSRDAFATEITEKLSHTIYSIMLNTKDENKQKSNK